VRAKDGEAAAKEVEAQEAAAQEVEAQEAAAQEAAAQEAAAQEVEAPRRKRTTPMELLRKGTLAACEALLSACAPTAFIRLRLFSPHFHLSSPTHRAPLFAPSLLRTSSPRAP
jgi:hypothetical protein